MALELGSDLADAHQVAEREVAVVRERERIVSTYLGNGIALPHGTNEARSAVLRTGLAVAQKADESPVTEADQRGEALILEHLARRFPSVPVALKPAL